MGIKPLRIAVVCSTLNQLGGPAVHIRNLYTHLNGGEFRLTLIFCSAVEKELRDFLQSGGVSVQDMIFIPHAKKRVLVPFVWELRDIFRREKYDLVHAFETQTQVLAGLAACWAGTDKFLCQCEAQFLPSTISFPKRILFRILNSFLKDYFSRTITVSDGLAKELVAKKFRPPDRIEVVHLGISYPFSENTKDPSRPGYDSRAPVIGSLSRLSVEKGLDRFIRAASRVAREIPSARFVICGDGKEQEALQSLAQKMSLDSRIEFRPWARDSVAMLKTYDIFVMPSLREGLPTTLLEAMATGCPVVASDIEGIRDVVSNGVDGILVDTADEQSFAQAIISLCRRPDMATQMGNEGAEKVRTGFNVVREMQRMREIYHEIIGERRP